MKDGENMFSVKREDGEPGSEEESVLFTLHAR